MGKKKLNVLAWPDSSIPNVPNLQEFLAPLFASPGTGVALFDSSLRFKALNDALAGINGLNREAHLGKTPRQILGALGNEAESFFEKGISTGEPGIFELKGRLSTRLTPGHWIETYVPIRSQENRVANLYVLIMEVTERKKLDDALFGLSGRLSYLKHNLRTSVFELRRRGYEGDSEIRLLRALEVLERCTTDTADVLNAVQPKVVSFGTHSADICDLRPQRNPVDLDSGSSNGSTLLSRREHEVLRLLASNNVNKEIAANLGISVRTVESHRRRLMEKLGIHSLTELVRFAIRHHIVEA